MIWSDLFPRIQIHVAGCPEMLIEDMVRQTAIKFCRESKIWEEQLDNLYPVEGVQRYQLILPDESSLLSLASATQGSEEDDDLEEHWPTINVFGLLYFPTVPSAENGPIAIRAILRPSDTATGVLDRIGLDYDLALIHGTIAALQSIPNKDWSSLQTVSYHNAIYYDKLTEAKVNRVTGNTEQPLRTTPHVSF